MSRSRAPCSHCGQALAHGLGRCIACYFYWRRHGAERPARFFRPVPCAHCGQLAARFRGRCKTCYAYWRRTGRDRGPHLLDPRLRRRCRVCSGPASTRRGQWCARCYLRAYRRRKKEAVG